MNRKIDFGKLCWLPKNIIRLTVKVHRLRLTEKNSYAKNLMWIRQNLMVAQVFALNDFFGFVIVLSNFCKAKPFTFSSFSDLSFL